MFAPSGVQRGRFLDHHSGRNVQFHALHTLWATKAAQGGRHVSVPKRGSVGLRNCRSVAWQVVCEIRIGKGRDDRWKAM